MTDSDGDFKVVDKELVGFVIDPVADRPTVMPCFTASRRSTMNIDMPPDSFLHLVERRDHAASPRRRGRAQYGAGIQ